MCGAGRGEACQYEAAFDELWKGLREAANMARDKRPAISIEARCRAALSLGARLKEL